MASIIWGFYLFKGKCVPDSLSVHFAGLHCCRRLGKFYRKSDYMRHSSYTPRNLAELDSSLVSRSAGPLPDGWKILNDISWYGMLCDVVTRNRGGEWRLAGRYQIRK